MVTPRNLGNAPLRNLMRRRIREIYRRNKGNFPDNGALLVLVKRAADFATLREELFSLGGQITGQRARTMDEPR